MDQTTKADALGGRILLFRTCGNNNDNNFFFIKVLTNNQFEALDSTTTETLSPLRGKKTHHIPTHFSLDLLSTYLFLYYHELPLFILSYPTHFFNHTFTLLLSFISSFLFIDTRRLFSWELCLNEISLGDSKRGGHVGLKAALLLLFRKERAVTLFKKKNCFVWFSGDSHLLLLHCDPQVDIPFLLFFCTFFFFQIQVCSSDVHLLQRRSHRAAESCSYFL